MNKENCTEGPVAVDGVDVRGAGEDRSIFASSFNSDNAELIAEAFNVLHETGFTPRELATFIKKIARMETASEFDERTDDGMSGDDAVDTLSTLIEEARQYQSNPNP
jgi:hypothetical protein